MKNTDGTEAWRPTSEPRQQTAAESSNSALISLLPCPFCGGSNLQTGKGWRGHSEGYVHCRTCGGHIGRTRGQLSGAIKSWNTRAR
ncbi:MAG: restriction alleviation protein, Lar family [Desulfuromonadaceae bacterium]|nr:restriction alleviation protein, Lar family [Desulfuromonadaceae bacterium]